MTEAPVPECSGNTRALRGGPRRLRSGAVSPQTESTIGSVSWDGMAAGTDGEQISLIVPAYFQAHHMPYLDAILATRLSALFGDVPISFRLDPGKLTRSSTETRYDSGSIVITGIEEPWPDGAALRDTLDDAFNEAGAVEAEQMKRAGELVAHLRKTGQR